MTAAWVLLLIFPPEALRRPNKPLTKRSLCGFGFSCFSLVKHPHPPRAAKQPALASCVNCLQTPCSEPSMNKGTNMTGMLRNNSSGWEMLSWRKYVFPHPVFWVHIMLSYHESLRYFDISWMILLFFKKRNVLEIEYFWKSGFSYLPFLSTRDDFNIKVLQAFVELHEFADLNLVQALRWEEWFSQTLSK